MSNNTQYAVKEVADSLFCILVDNVPEQSRYIERAATANLTQFHQLESRHRSHQWRSAPNGKNLPAETQKKNSV